MLWFWITIISQFCNAGAMVLDKFLLAKSFPRVSVLSFWTGVWNLLGVVFVFWDFHFFPGWNILILALCSGIAFTVGLQFYYMGIKTGEASHISPLTGGIMTIVSFVCSYLFLGERLTAHQMIAVGLLVLGSLLISFEKSKKHNGWHIGMLYAIIAGVFLSGSYILARSVYIHETFSTGFVWARVGSFAAVLPFLFITKIRNDIFKKDKAQKQSKSTLPIFVVNKSLAAVYFVGINFAISLASATMVNALAGLQYAVLLILIYFCTKFFPKFFREQFTPAELAQETIAIVVIAAGLTFIVI